MHQFKLLSFPLIFAVFTTTTFHQEMAVCNNSFEDDGLLRNSTIVMIIHFDTEIIVVHYQDGVPPPY